MCYMILLLGMIVTLGVQCTVQDTSNLLFSAELPYRQSTDSCVAKHSYLGSVHRHFTKSPQRPHKESMDTSQRVQGIAEKDLRIKCHEIE